MLKTLAARVATVGGTALGLVALVALPASASVDPAVSTAVTGGFTDTTSLLTGILIPALLGLVVIGIAVRVGVKYLRRGASS